MDTTTTTKTDLTGAVGIEKIIGRNMFRVRLLTGGRKARRVSRSEIPAALDALGATEDRITIYCGAGYIYGYMARTESGWVYTV